MVDVNTNVFMNVCLQREKKMARENSFKHKRRGLERQRGGKVEEEPIE